MSIAIKSDLLRYRYSLGLFIFGLVVSGLTAFPLLHELNILSKMLGIENVSQYHSYSGLRYWIAFVNHGLEVTYAQFPFIAYGTDWLAFGHLVIAMFFIKPLLSPQGNVWVLKCGLVACAAVIPLTLIAGEVRGIPMYWRLIDCGFGIFGAIPLLYCLHLVRKMEQAVMPTKPQL